MRKRKRKVCVCVPALKLKFKLISPNADRRKILIEVHCFDYIALKMNEKESGNPTR